MKIKSAKFVKGIMGEDEILEDQLPKIVFVGRSNVGKSSVINSLVGRRDLAKSSNKAGKTKEINFYLINQEFYLVDLPGYGFASASVEERENLRKLIYWYLLFSSVPHKKVVLIVDAKVGMTDNDIEILRRLDERNMNIVIVANKVDIIKKSNYKKRLSAIQEQVGKYKIIPYSTEEKIGVGELIAAILNQ